MVKRLLKENLQVRAKRRACSENVPCAKQMKPYLSAPTRVTKDAEASRAVAKDSVPVVVIYPHTILCHSKMHPTKTI